MVNRQVSANWGSAIAAEPADENVVRLAVVNTPQFSGLLDSLLPEFERQTGITVDVYSGSESWRRSSSSRTRFRASMPAARGNR